MSLLLSMSLFFMDDEPEYDAFDFNALWTLLLKLLLLVICLLFHLI